MECCSIVEVVFVGNLMGDDLVDSLLELELGSGGLVDIMWDLTLEGGSLV